MAEPLSPYAKGKQRRQSVVDALTYAQTARNGLDGISLADLRHGDGWRPIIDAMIVLDTAIAALRFALNP